MPPGIKCRTCKIARQALFIESVKDGDPDAAVVNYARIGVAVLILAVLISLV
jgi:hypothetical protein